MPDLKSTDYEVVIIGAGPIGLACGIAAKQTRLRYLILEKGCLTQSVYDYPANMTFFSTSDNIELGNIPFCFTWRPSNKTRSAGVFSKSGGVF